jgi:hypothetical protein
MPLDILRSRVFPTVVTTSNYSNRQQNVCGMIILLMMTMCDQQLTKCRQANKGLATLYSTQVSLTMLTIHLPA